jgi:hypothetical protein
MPSISRRRLLAGGSVLGAVVASGYGALAPASALPDGLAKMRATLRPVPEVRARPTITDGHVEDAITDVESTIARAETTWDAVENPDAAVESLPGLADPPKDIGYAKDRLQDARSNSGWSALFDCELAAKRAGEAIGGARLALDDVDGETMAENASEILDGVDAARDRVAYQVADPSVGLAELFFVEKQLVSARLNAHRGGVYTGQREPSAEYDDNQMIRTWGSHLAARRSLADARRLYDDYRERTAGERRDLDEHVRTVEAAIRADAIESTFSSDEFDERTAEIEALPEGPYRTFRYQTMFYVQNADVQRPGWLGAELPLYRAVKNARVLLGARALAAIREDEPLSAGADRVPGTLLDRTKNEALATLESQKRETDDRPLLELLLEEGRRLVWAGDAQFDGDADVDHPRARALARYALGNEYLRELPDVLATLESPGS